MRPRDLLMQALLQETRPVVDQLRREGWHVDVIMGSDEDTNFYGVRLEIDLNVVLAATKERG